MAGFASLIHESGMEFVPISPLLNNAFSMLFQKGQQERALAEQRAARKQAGLLGGIGMGVQAGTTLGGAALLSQGLQQPTGGPPNPMVSTTANFKK